MSFKIVITDNETGKELIREEHAQAIIGAYVDKQKTASIACVQCKTPALMSAIIGAERSIKTVVERDPKLQMFYKIAKIGEKVGAIDNSKWVDERNDFETPEDFTKNFDDIFKR